MYIFFLFFFLLSISRTGTCLFFSYKMQEFWIFPLNSGGSGTYLWKFESDEQTNLYKYDKLFILFMKGDSILGHHIGLNPMHRDIRSCQQMSQRPKSLVQFLIYRVYQKMFVLQSIRVKNGHFVWYTLLHFAPQEFLCSRLNFSFHLSWGWLRPRAARNSS